MLALFTNAEDLAHVGAALEPFFAARRIPFWWQRMRGVTKEELGQLFRSEVDSVLLGLDTFWYGADFRLHERQLFERGADGQWSQRMLYP